MPRWYPSRIGEENDEQIVFNPPFDISAPAFPFRNHRMNETVDMHESEPVPWILVVEDDPKSQRILERMLTKRGYRVDLASDAPDALDLLQDNDYDITLVDYQLPTLMGHEFIEQARTVRPLMEFVAISGYGTADVGQLLMNAGACDFFDKHNLNDERFHRVIDGALRRRVRTIDEAQHRARLAEMNRRGAFAGLIGNSRVMVEVKDNIRLVAPRTQMPVLILGPSGSGKERIAEATHDASGVPGQFVARNLTEVAESLFESELFGYAKGAFTGAIRDTAGLCEQAANGTLFLDEIGLLPLNLQGKLLRLLNERRYNRVGDPTTRKFTGRIICATNADLGKMVSEGTFREDLLFRINGFPITAPDLNSRIEDIPHLTYHFMQMVNREWSLDPPITSIEPEAIRALQNHDWRANNVRELRNVVSQAALRSTDEASLRSSSSGSAVEIRVSHLPPQIARNTSQPVPRSPSGSPAAPVSTTEFRFPQYLMDLNRKDAKQLVIDEFERQYCLHLLATHDYNVTHAAKAADMQRSNFRRLMSRLDINTPTSD